MKRKLIVMAKAPIAGHAKSRMIPLLGAQGAAELHQALTHWLLTKLCKNSGNDRRAEANYVTELWCASDIEHPFFKQCADDFGVILKLQQGDDLGDRQLYAIKTALQDCDTVVVIGSDVASLTKDHIVEAFEAIEDGSEIVISPAKDGGYGLIGTSMVPVNIFTGITWGTESVFNELKSNIDKSRLNWDLLPAVWDLDRPEDLANLEKEPMLSDELSTIIRNRVNHNIVK